MVIGSDSDAQESKSGDRLETGGLKGEESYFLQCQYCDWSSLDIDVQFSKATKITEQLAKQRKSLISAKPEGNSKKDAAAQDHSREDAFTNLATFYKEQLSESGDLQGGYSNSPYSSPAHLARIVSLYGGLSVNALKKTKEKPQPMREARGDKEGILTYTHDDAASETTLLQRLEKLKLKDTTTAEQCLFSPLNNDAKLITDLWPVATPLRTRKGRRCKTCRQFLSRPDPKINNLRYKIRLLAQTHIPRISVRPFAAQSSTTAAAHTSFQLRADDTHAQPLLHPHILQQFILTIRNPIFEPVKITLATPTATPGRVASRVTILCPSFTVGPAGDVWDEALAESKTSAMKADGGRQAAMASLTGGGDDGERQPEAGKVWEKGRSWTSVVIEVVPSLFPPQASGNMRSETVTGDLEEDDEVLEIPVFVRVEWEAQSDHELDPEYKEGRRTVVKAEGSGKVKKEVGYWCVLGVGRIGKGP
ncbi:hypothetical protein LTR62_006324 [Meristemomyces frigidus]|uniref:Dynactin subunit 4 n=1 Tax=Meristemomyces frigidus TaxID=1508187 RepID=A0AAN7TNJ6_9PEZI|nr:hypothetical protein LTR62_006324 [Meristemomyces frigidus]